MEENETASYDTSYFYGSVKYSSRGRTKEMNEWECALGNLIDTIKSTEQYRAYVREKERVNRFPELKEQIDSYRIRNFEIQNMTNDEELFFKMEEFEKEYEKFRENPIVANFLAAELSLCRLIQNINTRITAALDFE